MPSPLIALEHEELLGGLSFTRYAKPGSEEMAVWINTVFVAPQHRGRGVAGKLIDVAEQAALALGITELFVLSSMPDLYNKHGWRYVDTVDGSTVLGKLLNL